MKILRLSIILDVDDVLLDCNNALIEKLKDRYPDVSSNDIIAWGMLKDSRLNHRFDYFDSEFIRHQPVLPGAEEFVRELSRYCEIFIQTAVDTAYIQERVERIKEVFPEINPDHIIFGKRKDLSTATFMVDDNEENILNSRAEIPILFRRPWNRSLTGLIAANTYGDVLTIIKTYINGFTENINPANPFILALIGPSGSGKNNYAEYLKEHSGFYIPKSYTTANQNNSRYKIVSKNVFLDKISQNELFEYSVYGTNYYGLPVSEIDNNIKNGNLVIPIDITGAIMLKQKYPVIMVFVHNSKKSIIENILKKDLPEAEKVNRILAVNAEKKNKILCDYSASSLDELVSICKRCRAA